MRGVRLRERLRNGVDRPGGNARAHQVAAERLDCRTSANAFSSSARSASRFSSRLALVAKRGSAREVRPADALAELPELAVVGDTEEDLAVAGLELVVRADVRVRAAEQARRAARMEPVGGVRHEQAQARVEQRRLDALALAGALARVERHQDAAHRDVAGEVIDDRNAQAHRFRIPREPFTLMSPHIACSTAS